MSNEKRSESAESDDEIARRRDEGLRRLLKMKPEPHKGVGGKKPAAKNADDRKKT